MVSPKDLFNQALTYPKHEADDIHYIGEALPVASEIEDVVVNGSSSVGISMLPAKEDHSHAVDLTNYYTQTEVDLLLDGVIAGTYDLSNYYTKPEANALFVDNAELTATLANYYTKAQVDALLANAGVTRACFSFSGRMVFKNARSTMWVAPRAGTFSQVRQVFFASDTFSYGIYKNGVLHTSISSSLHNIPINVSIPFVAGDTFYIVFTNLVTLTAYDMTIYLEI